MRTHVAIDTRERDRGGSRSAGVHHDAEDAATETEEEGEGQCQQNRGAKDAYYVRAVSQLLFRLADPVDFVVLQ